MTVPARGLRAIAAAALALVVGCSDDSFTDTTPFCVPAMTATCSCPTGAPGARVCTDDGLDYGACACLPDAGTADAPSGIDAAPAP